LESLRLPPQEVFSSVALLNRERELRVRTEI